LDAKAHETLTLSRRAVRRTNPVVFRSFSYPVTLRAARRPQCMRGFRDQERTQAFLSSSGPIRQHFAFKRHLLRASLYRKQLAARFAVWHRSTEVTQDPSAF
jgi:hypothetical protein